VGLEPKFDFGSARSTLVRDRPRLSYSLDRYQFGFRTRLCEDARDGWDPEHQRPSEWHTHQRNEFLWGTTRITDTASLPTVPTTVVLPTAIDGNVRTILNATKQPLTITNAGSTFNNLLAPVPLNTKTNLGNAFVPIHDQTSTISLFSSSWSLRYQSVPDPKELRFAVMTVAAHTNRGRKFMEGPRNTECSDHKDLLFRMRHHSSKSSNGTCDLRPKTKL